MSTPGTSKADVNAKTNRGWTPLHRASGKAYKIKGKGREGEAKLLKGGQNDVDELLRQHSGDK